MKLLRDLDVSGKRVFVRADLDVPLEGLEQVHTRLESETATRLTNLKGTVDYLLREGAKQVVIAGHIDRPDGPDPAKSTKQLLPTLEKVLGGEIAFISDIYSSSDSREVPSKNEAGSPQGRTLLLLENLRFWPGETKNDLEFAKKLASFGDVYVNEAFGNCHREHASMVAVAELFRHTESPEQCRMAAGLHLEEEVKTLTKVLDMPARPFVAIIGGAKMETKIPVIQNLAKISHHVLIGGELPLEIERLNMKFGENVVVAELNENKKDIDLESVHLFIRHIEHARTVVWNGPMGLFEEGFETGTRAIARAIVESRAESIAGGGETAQFLEKEGLLSSFSFVSAGGGAMLEFLAGKTLPGIAALE